MVRHTNIDSRRVSLALLATLLLLAGAILGHPDMSVADSCTGFHEFSCTEDDQCDGFCDTLTGAIPCVSDDECRKTTGMCYCYLNP